MSFRVRVLALLVPALAMVAAEGDPAPAPAPAPGPAPIPLADAAPAPAPAPIPLAETEPAPAAKPKPVAPDTSSPNNLDLRLTLGGGGGGINRMRDDDLDVETDLENGGSGKLAAHLVFLRARPGGIGFAVGGGFFAASHTGEIEPGVAHPESTVNAVGLDIYGAFVLRPTRNWHFELPALVLSGGSAKVETEGEPDSDDGWYSQSALQVGAYYTFDFGLQLGVDLGGSWFYAVVDREVGPVDHTFIYSGGGAYINLNAGFRF